MATQTRPFMITGAALAGAAAIVAASPAIAPSISLSPTALSAAKFELTTFSDVFTIPSGTWISSYFQGYGGLIGGSTDPVTGNYTPNLYAPGCYNDCYASNVEGIVYLAADALINGNGQGWDTAGGVPVDPTKPYDPVTNPWEIQPWGTSAVNYYFEGGQYYGVSPFLQYVADNAVGGSNPVLQTLINLFFAKPSSFAQIFTAAVSTTAALVSNVPLVGPYVAGAMYAYLGANGYTPGLSGVLNYVIDLVTGNITPAASTSPAASVLAAAVAGPAAALQSTVKRALDPAKAAAPAVSVAAPSAAEVATVKPVTAVSDAVATAKADASVKTEKSEATESATESTGSDATSGSTETKPAETSSTETSSTETEATEVKPEVKPETKPADTKPADTTPAATKPADAASSVASAATASTPAATKPAESPAKTRKHPVRDAVQKATKQIQSALGGAKAGAAK